MSIDKLENQLIDQLTPVKVVSPRNLVVLFYGISTFISIAVLLAIGVRPDLFLPTFSWDILIYLAGFMIGGIFLGYYLIQLAIPGKCQNLLRLLLVGLGLLLGGMALFMIQPLLNEDLNLFDSTLHSLAWAHVHDGYMCTLITILSSLSVIGGVSWILTRLTVLYPTYLALLLTICSVSIGSLVSAFHCSLDTFSHRFMGHSILVLLGGILVWPLVTLWLKHLIRRQESAKLEVGDM